MRVGIIGAGHAGVAAAEVAAGRGAQVTLFSAESVLPYFRPRIISLATGFAQAQAIAFHPAGWYAERGIDLRLGAPVRAVEQTAHGFELRADRGAESFDRLALATGASPFTPPLYAERRPGLSPLWTMEDAEHLSTRLKAGQRLCVVGGGILGLELALSALKKGNLSVTLVERAPRLMAAQFGDAMAAELRRDLERRGAEVLTDADALHLEARPEGLALAFADGRTCVADQVVYALGARPNLELARALGLSIGRGIQVDSHLETSVPGLFACGDAIEIDGITRSIALEATRQGRLVGENLLGAGLEHRPSVSPLTFRLDDFEIDAIGPAQPDGSRIHRLALERGSCALVLQGDRLVGIQALGARAAFRAHEKQIGQVLGASEAPLP